MRCDNDASLTSRIVSPQCWWGTARWLVTVTYSEVESDTLTLCDACARAVKTDARRHGYKVTKRGVR